ncbi:MAG: T9SS type A sorting domain-containing protein [Bacteroidales bacterium]
MNWSYCYVSFDDLGYDLRFGDTVRFRFAFISDSIQNNRDGLMYDNLYFNDFYEGIDSRFQSDFFSSVFPNPADKWVTIEFDNNDLSSFHLEIIDISGRLMIKESGGEQGSFKVDISAFQPGSYLYRLVDRSSIRASRGQFIVK